MQTESNTLIEFVSYFVTVSSYLNVKKVVLCFAIFLRNEIMKIEVITKWFSKEGLTCECVCILYPAQTKGAKNKFITSIPNHGDLFTEFCPFRRTKQQCQNKSQRDFE